MEEEATVLDLIDAAVDDRAVMTFGSRDLSRR